MFKIIIISRPEPDPALRMFSADLLSLIFPDN